MSEGERVRIEWFESPPVAFPRDRVVTATYEDDDEDDSIWQDLLEKSLAEIFVDHILMPLMGLAIASLLLLISCASIWGSFALVAKTLALIA